LAGYNLIALGLTDYVCVVTEKKLVNMAPSKMVVESLAKAGVKFEVFDDVCVEPTNKSLPCLCCRWWWKWCN
jgi:alcohol dehydrogenase class IV